MLQRVKQIIEFFIVYFKDRTSDILRFTLLLKDLLQSPRNYSISFSLLELTKHSIGFTRTCLTICKNSWILTLEKCLYMPSCYCRVYLGLAWSTVENGVKGISILAIIYHIMIVFDVTRVYSWSKTTKNLNILTLIRFWNTLAARILVNSTFDKRLGKLDSYFSDWTMKRYRRRDSRWGMIRRCCKRWEHRFEVTGLLFLHRYCYN